MAWKLDFCTFLILTLLFLCGNSFGQNDDAGIYNVGVGRADITGPAGGVVLVIY